MACIGVVDATGALKALPHNAPFPLSPLPWLIDPRSSFIRSFTEVRRLMPPSAALFAEAAFNFANMAPLRRTHTPLRTRGRGQSMRSNLSATLH